MVLPADLEQSFKRNTTYAADPYGLAEEPLRVSDARRRDAATRAARVADSDPGRVTRRRPPRARAGRAAARAGGHRQGRGVLVSCSSMRALSNVKWIGEIPSEAVPAFGPAITASLAAKLANVVAAQ